MRGATMKNVTKFYSARLSIIMTVPMNIYFFWKGMTRVLMEIHQIFFMKFRVIFPSETLTTYNMKPETIPTYS